MKELEKVKLLHDVITRFYGNYEELTRAYLDAGVQLLGLEVGIASHVRDDEYRVEAVSSNQMGIEVGALFALKDTYCVEVIKSRKTVVVDRAGETEPFKSHPVYMSLKLESYISAPVYVDGKIFGTLNFSSQNPKKEKFTEFDVDLLELMATSLGRFVESKIHGERAIVAEKMASLGRMAGGLAHEINNPLAIIRGSAELLQRISMGEDPKFEKYIDRIINTVDRISVITSGLRDFIGDTALGAIQANNLLNLCEVAMEKTEMKGIRVDLEVDPGLEVFCQDKQIVEALRHLLSNAVDATASTSIKWIKLLAHNHGDVVRLQIVDSGSGITEDVRSKIFEPFYTTKMVGSGPGLGLCVSRGLIEHNHGSLDFIAGEVNTTFRIELPKAS